MQDIRIAAVSINSPLGQVDQVLTDTGNWCRQAKEAGAEFVLFPELLVHGHCTPNTWDLAEASFAFQDPRLEEMLFRLRARNYPDTLSSEEQAQWEAYRWARMNDAEVASLTLTGFAREIERLNQVPLDDAQRQVLEELVMHVEAMMPPQAFG